MAKKYIDIRIVGFEEEIHEFLRVCQTIQQLGYGGANREIKVNVDGDGTGRLKFFTHKTDKIKIQDPCEDCFEEIPIIENFDYENIEELYIGE